MALRVLKWAGIALAVLVGLALAAGLYVLWPEGNIDMRRASIGTSTQDILRACLDLDTLNVDLAALSATCDAAITDEQFNAILDNVFEELKPRVKSLSMVEAYKAWIQDGYILIRANVTLAGVIPAQVTVTAVPELRDDRLLLTVKSAKLGKLPLSVASLFNYAGIDNGGSDTLELGIDGLPSYIRLSSLAARRGRMTMEASIRARSLAELEQIARDIAPAAIQTIREQLINEL